MKLCEYEVDVLRECNGEQVPGLTWGAAMSVALEALEGEGLIARAGGVYSITAKGRERLKAGAGES